MGFTIELNSDDVDEVDPSCCDRYCIGYRSPRNPCEVKIVFNTRNLKRARDWGLEIVHGLVFPLFSIYGSEVIASTFFIAAMISAILSTYTFASEAQQGQYPTLEVVQFSFIGFCRFYLQHKILPACKRTNQTFLHVHHMVYKSTASHWWPSSTRL